MEMGNSVLVNSVKGQNRSCTIITAYLMRKYHWSLLKTLEFMSCRMPNMDIKEYFILQLMAYEEQLIKMNIGPKTSNWAELSDSDTNLYENEELLLRNTYLNSQTNFLAGSSFRRISNGTGKLKWADETKKHLIATIIEEKDYNKENIPTPLSITLKKRTMDNNLINNCKIKSTKKKRRQFLGKSLNIENRDSSPNIRIGSPCQLDIIDTIPAKAQLIPKLNTYFMNFNKEKMPLKKSLVNMTRVESMTIRRSSPYICKEAVSARPQLHISESDSKCINLQFCNIGPKKTHIRMYSKIDVPKGDPVEKLNIFKKKRISKCQTKINRAKSPKTILKPSSSASSLKNIPKSKKSLPKHARNSKRKGNISPLYSHKPSTKSTK